MEQKIFSPMELDAIGEVMNISLGASATAVSNMLNHRVDITTPKVSVVSVEDFSLGDLEPAVAVEIKYVSGVKGNNILLLKRDDVKKIVDILMGTETPDEEFQLDELTVSAVCEVMNQMMGAASTALSDFLGRPVNISTPQPFTLDNLDEFKKDHFQSQDGVLVIVRFQLGIEGVLASEFLNVMSVDLARELLAGFGIKEETKQTAQSQTAAPAVSAEPPPQSPVLQQTGASPSQAMIDQLTGGGTSVPDVQPQAAAAPPPQQAYIPAAQPQAAPPSVIHAAPVQLPSFDAAKQLGEEQAQNLELIMSVPLEVSVEIGRATRRVEDILTFTKGTLVVLDKLAGDQADIFVNGLCVAHGDVVVVDDNFGVRITEVVHQPDLFKLQNK